MNTFDGGVRGDYFKDVWCIFLPPSEVKFNFILLNFILCMTIKIQGGFVNVILVSIDKIMFAHYVCTL